MSAIARPPRTNSPVVLSSRGPQAFMARYSAFRGMSRPTFGGEPGSFRSQNHLTTAQIDRQTIRISRKLAIADAFPTSPEGGAGVELREGAVSVEGGGTLRLDGVWCFRGVGEP